MIKLLIIDDEKDTVEHLKDFFVSRGLEVFTAYNAYDGIAITQVEKPDIILLDIRMGTMNGIEALVRIKEVSKESKVIIITCAAEDSVKKEAMLLGADDYVEKPINITYLESTVGLEVKRLLNTEKQEV
ncbi:MAG: response regulator [Candidatus Zapsychrus exili]|nr:response regulator [Candidatus Zapsychrus exili]